MNSKQWFKLWQDELLEVVTTFDVSKFREFYKKWQARGYYEESLPDDDRIVDITIHKIAYHLTTATPEQRAIAEKWLLERGFRTDLGVMK